MTENSKIEWTNHTFNPWIGCTKVSKGCDNCYAEAQMDKWLNKAKWGPSGTRVKTVDSNWAKLAKWDTRLNGTNKRERVFVASLADVFEKYDNSDIANWRFDLWNIVEKLQNLDILLLTKRPENILDCAPYTWHNQAVTDQTEHWERGPIVAKWPDHIWTGTSIENQKLVYERLPELVKVPGKHFLSLEPLLGPITLRGGPNGIGGQICHRCGEFSFYDQDGQYCPHCGRSGATVHHHIHWIIVGGESGPNARPMDLAWVYDILDQCRQANIPVSVKQLGARWAKEAGAIHRKGGDPDEWLAELRVRMFPGEAW